jgi:predicted acyl esterase
MARRGSGFAPAQGLDHGRVVDVRSKDGVRLHAEVFGPDDGYPVVLAHGITCAIQVWA